jgi:putative Mn2+ efflux pump MntP
MKIRSNLPKEFGQQYDLSFQEQTAIIEMSFLNYFILDQVRMPMVKDMLGGYIIVECFQKCLAACILVFIKAGLITDDFYNAHKDILDVNHGIKENTKLSAMGVSDLSYDVSRMINRYMVIMGHEAVLIEEKDDLYGNEKFFTPYNHFA